MEVLRISLLGPVRIRCAGREVAAGSGQRQAVLAVLALRAGRVVTVEELADLVWGEAAPPSAAAVVRNHVSRLRAAFGAARAGTVRPLVSRAGGYALEPAGRSLDTEEFDRLADAAAARQAGGEPERAAGLYREALALGAGTALGGVPGPYAERQRARLTERRLGALESCLEVELGLGGHARLVAELTALCAEHPLREGLRGLLMTALYRSGRQAEALEVYAAARRVLAAELGVAPGPGLRRLQQRILGADPGLAPPGADLGPAARALTRPAQLPSDVGDFTGRSSEVEAIAQALAGPRPAAVVLVTGGVGIGKTTVAVRAARTVRAAFPDGQLYAELHGARGEPADPADLLGGFLRALGVPAQEVPAAPVERAQLYRSLLAGRRVLLVLDGAEGETQVRPLLPGGPGCAVLVTSRARLGGLAPATAVRLGPLARAEAVELLSAVAGPDRIAAEPAAADEIAAACGGLPLALRIAATKIAARPAWSVTAFAGRLREEGRRLGELRVGDLAVDAHLRAGLRQLTEEPAEALRRLAGAERAGAAPGRQGPGAVPRGPGAEETTGVLGRLVDAGLLEPPRDGLDRHHLHDLVRLFVLAEPAAGAARPPAAHPGDGVRDGSAPPAPGREGLPGRGPVTCAAG
ncbi:transcriptional regulator [Kitasatospora sp. NPDC049258]|uniref:AfsR/SARP family transcriptional regulator n=1 Tax=Kitasatospora sp. NPDC049258 TaxID=3155394 RepID=UPI0034312CD5